MKRFLQYRSHRWGYDGWAVQVCGAPLPLPGTVSTTRAEAREVKAEMSGLPLKTLKVVKVRIRVEAV